MGLNPSGFVLFGIRIVFRLLSAGACTCGTLFPLIFNSFCIIQIESLFLRSIMSRILAIDYGRKRTGVAVSDALQLIANGLATVPTHELLAFLLDYVAREPVERILVGLPRRMNNEASESMKYIAPFVAALKKRLPDMPVEYVDERFTSVLAHRAMLEGGLKKKARQNKALVDEISATILLRDYLESRRIGL